MLPHDRWPDVERLFRTVLDADADEAARLLADADADVAAEVQALLAAEHEADTFFGRPPHLGNADEVEDDLPRGARLGPWEVAEELGRGGMGTVYRARRADGAYAQDVAVKVVHRGMDSAQIVRRFQQERTLLATLAHEGVARLIDGGVAGDGRPYLVMELVEGQPLTAYADARRLPVEARIRLFLDVCAAVSHAHQRLVVHRDLKPSNILVTDGDARPHVKLLDFGIARLLTSSDDGEALTLPELRLFTPRYAAPEQATGAPVTTATDVYSLGAVLFELLVGEALRLAPGQTMPERASTVLRTMPRPDAEAVAHARATSPARLERMLRGDLDAVCHLALRPEPHARYPSVEALADDLRRHLTGLPVRARGNTRRYLVASFVRRHRWPVAVAAGATIAVLAATAAVAVQNRRIAHERDRAEEVATVLENVFLRIDPGGQTEGGASTRDLLDRGAEETAQMADTEAKAHLLDVVARVYRALGDHNRALPRHEQAVRLYTALRGRDAPETLAAEHHLAYLLTALGRTDEAEAMYRRVLEVRRRTGDPTGLVESTSDLADLYLDTRRLAEARALIAEGLAVLERHPNAGPPSLEGPIARAGFLYQQALIEQQEGRLDDAVARFHEALNLYRAHRGPNHIYTAAVETKLASLLLEQGNGAAAGPLLEHARSVQERAWGPSHPWVYAVYNTQATQALQAGDRDSAQALYDRIRARAEAAGDTLWAARAKRQAEQLRR